MRFVPDFNRDRYEGQLNPSEREELYNLIMTISPKYVFEIGTCRGGGTTLFISGALLNNHNGHLYTFENNPKFFQFAKNLYESDEMFIELSKRIKFNFGDSLEVCPPILQAIADDRLNCRIQPQFIDVCMLDAGEDSTAVVWEFAMMKPFMPIGSYLVCHDWGDGKTQYLKPLIENDNDWLIEKIEIHLAIIRRVGMVRR